MIWDLDEEWMRAETGAVGRNKVKTGKVLWEQEIRLACGSQSCRVCLESDSWEAHSVRSPPGNLKPVESQTAHRNNSRVF